MSTIELAVRVKGNEAVQTRGKSCSSIAWLMIDYRCQRKECQRLLFAGDLPLRCSIGLCRGLTASFFVIAPAVQEGVSIQNSNEAR
jgi:hypothetical protein